VDSQLFFLLILLILSGFFSGAEIAIVSLTEAKVRSLVEKGSKTASIVQSLKNKPQRLLITILVGNNLVNIGGSVLATAWATEKFGDHILGIITGVLMFLILIFGEIFPKTFAERFSRQFAFLMARPILYLQYALFPLVWILEKVMNFLLRRTGAKIEKMTEDEIKAMVSLGEEAGAIEREERMLISNVLEFGDTRVSQVMTPRAKICSLSCNSSISQAVDLLIENGHSRIPIYKEDIDNVIGILTIQELLRGKRNESEKFTIMDLDLNQAIVVPETKYLHDLFKEFQWKHQHMAMVVNEHGSVTGLITMEDLLEEIMGEISDESDDDEKIIEHLGDDSWRVKAEVTIEELNELLEITFDCDPHKTVGYLLLDKFQKIPRRGEDIKIKNFHFFIEKKEKNKLESVRVVRV
jgi:putative hemolysin